MPLLTLAAACDSDVFFEFFTVFSVRTRRLRLGAGRPGGTRSRRRSSVPQRKNQR